MSRVLVKKEFRVIPRRKSLFGRIMDWMCPISEKKIRKLLVREDMVTLMGFIDEHGKDNEALNKIEAIIWKIMQSKEWDDMKKEIKQLANFARRQAIARREELEGKSKNQQ